MSVIHKNVNNTTNASLDSIQCNTITIANNLNVSIIDSTIPLNSSYPLYYNSTTKEINSRNTQGSVLFMNNTSIQVLTYPTSATVLFTTTLSQSSGITGLTYAAEIFTNSLSTTILLSVNISHGFSWNGYAGMR